MAAKSKKTNAVRDLYLALTDDPELPTPVQHRIYEYGTRAEDEVLLARLAVLPSLDATLDARLRESTQARVRAAWTTRPGRTEQQILDMLEMSRPSVTLHSAIGAVPDLPDAVYEQLARNAGVKVSEALLTNPSVPFAVKRELAATLAPQLNPKWWQLESKLQTLFGAQLDLVPILAEHAAQGAVIAWALNQVSVPAEVAVKCANQLVDQMNGTVQLNNAGTLYDFAAALFTQEHLPNDVREQVYSWFQMMAHRVGSPKKQVDRVTLAWSRRPIRRADASHPERERVERAGTDSEMAAATELVLTSGSEELAIALAKNRDSGADELARIVGLISRQVRPNLAFERATDLPALAAFVAYGDVVPSDTLLRASGQPVEALIEVIRALRTKGAPIPVIIGKSEYLTPEVMAELPLSFSSGKGTMLARRAVTELLTQALSDTGDWQTFETLGANFDGPLNNLLLACGFISGTPPEAADLGDAEASEPATGTALDRSAVDAGTLPPPNATDPAGNACETLL